MDANFTHTEGLAGTHSQPSCKDYLSEMPIGHCRKRRSWGLQPQIPNQVLPSLLHSGKSGETGGVWHFPGADRGLSDVATGWIAKDWTFTFSEMLQPLSLAPV